MIEPFRNFFLGLVFLLLLLLTPLVAVGILSPPSLPSTVLGAVAYEVKIDSLPETYEYTLPQRLTNNNLRPASYRATIVRVEGQNPDQINATLYFEDSNTDTVRLMPGDSATILLKVTSATGAIETYRILYQITAE